MKTKQKTCHRKIRYTNSLYAFLTLLKLVTNGKVLDIDPDWELRVYPCDVCDGFHLGNKTAKISSRKSKRKRHMGIIGRMIATLKAKEQAQ